ncbi:mitoguardin-like [Varroa jacobsoni]|uniref:mitoguardin-like n=1 Tax=Varroa jacobsoni TaxID=62625 RepID=UPI000BF64852|nr:mitoguardin-like [Varroa jacobsoni]XP_022700185.1 mitoguardin-like [Varroa jacobsoni]
MPVSIRAGSSIRLPFVPARVKFILLACGSAILVVGVTTRLWLRWRRGKDAHANGGPMSELRTKLYSFRGLNGDIPQLRSMPSPLCVRCRQSREADRVSTATLGSSGRGSAAGGFSGAGGGTGNLVESRTQELSPQQLGVMGMEALDTAIHYWDDSIGVFQSLPVGQAANHVMALPTNAEAEFVAQLQIVMKQAFKLRDNCAKLFLDNTSLLFQISDDNRSSIAGGYSRDYDRFDARTVTSFDDESFVSAEGDIANLRDFEEALNPDDLKLYQNALQMLKLDGVPARAIRTQLVGCQSDEEYLAKLHCVRLAFAHLTSQPAIREMYVDAGSQILAGLLVYAEKDPKFCLEAYAKLIEWVGQPTNRDVMEQELRARGVTALTIYDVVFDFLLIEAFDDLDDPPQSVVSVIQNRWLSAGFRETALSTAIWSVIKAKKSRVKVDNGFFTHFYGVAENLTPVLAWGFLGTNQDLKKTCLFFKQEVMNLMLELFDFRKVRYTSVEEMAEDVYGLSQLTVDRIAQRLGI